MDRIHNLLNDIKGFISAQKNHDQKQQTIHMDRFSIGDTVKNINTSCMHYGSIGVVEDIEALPHNMGDVIVYKTTNSGDTWKENDVLKKTPSQLIRANIQMQQHREPSMIDDQTNTNDIISENIDAPSMINNPTNMNDPMDNADEDTDEKYNEYIEMALSSLKTIIYKAQTIVDHIGLDSVKENLTEPWLQGKIAIMDDYMSTVHDFVMFATETDDNESEAGDRPGLWENIRKKKDREGKKYRPAKPGDKDRPDPEQWKKLTK